ncbi:MAG TPA: glycosyltransferase family 4 protein [Rhizomicrobium sp.]
MPSTKSATNRFDSPQNMTYSCWELRRFNRDPMKHLNQHEKAQTDIGMEQIVRNRPKAIILSAASGYGGGERSLEMLLSLLAHDYELHLLIENRRHLSRCQHLLTGTDAKITPLPIWYRPLQILHAIVWLLRRWRLKPDFILTNTNKSAFVVALVSRLLPRVGKKANVYVRDFQWKQLNFIAKSLKRSLFLVPSPELVEYNGYLADHLRPRGPARWAVVPNAASIERTENPAALPEQLVGMRYILSLATITRWKGQEYAIEALGMLPSDIHLVISGDVADQSYLDQLIAMASTLGLGNRVHFLGFQDDPTSLLQNAICVAITSVSRHGGPETFGRVVIEAWMHSTPVVSFETGGPKHLIAAGATGFFAPEFDVSALAAAIRWIIDNPDGAAAIAKRGNHEVRDRYEREKIYELLLEIVRDNETKSLAPATSLR